MAAAGQLALDPLEIVELAIDDDMQPLVFVGDGLIACLEVDNAEPRVSEGDAAMRSNPVPLAIRPAMVQGLHTPLERSDRNGAAAREHGDNATHIRLTFPECSSERCLRPGSFYASGAAHVAGRQKQSAQ